MATSYLELIEALAERIGVLATRINARPRLEEVQALLGSAGGGSLTEAQMRAIMRQAADATGTGGGTTPAQGGGAAGPLIAINLQTGGTGANPDGYETNATSRLNQFGAAPDGGDHYRFAENNSAGRHLVGEGLGTLDAGTYRLLLTADPESKGTIRAGLEWGSGTRAGAYYSIDASNPAGGAALPAPTPFVLGGATGSVVTGPTLTANGIGNQKALVAQIVVPAGVGPVDFNVIGLQGGTDTYTGTGGVLHVSKMSIQRVA